MVQMIPETYTGKLINSELVIFNALKAIEDQPDWIVIHSLKQGRSLENLTAETDFVVLAPGYGILLIEAKGATAVEIDGNKWVMEGVPEEKKNKDPFEQLDRAGSNIRRYLAKKKLSSYNMPYARLVWFNRISEDALDQSKRDEGMEFFPWEIAWVDDLEKPAEAVKRTLENFVKNHLSLNGKAHDLDELTPERAKEIARSLRVNLKASADKDSAAKERRITVTQATKQQLEVLDAIAGNQYIYFEGGAGSGKTQLIVESALSHAKAGKTVLLTAWSVMMAEKLADRFAEVPNVHVEDVSSFLQSVTQTSKPEEMSGDDWYDRELAKAALKAIAQKPGLRSFDVLCIDEFQDIATKPDVCEALFAVLNPDGEEVIVLAGDDEQQIMATTTKVHAFDAVKALRPGFFKYALHVNCRQAPELSKAVHSFLGMDASKLKHRIPEGGEWSFEVVKTSSEGETQLKDLAKVLGRLLERFNGSDIRVLSPFGPKNSALAKLFAAQPEEIHSKEVRKMMPLLKHASSPEGRISWRSISKYKGLEQDVIVIMDINNSSKDWLEGDGKTLNEQLYVGMTRAKFHLVLLVSDGLFETN